MQAALEFAKTLRDGTRIPSVRWFNINFYGRELIRNALRVRNMMITPIGNDMLVTEDEEMALLK